MDSFYVVKVICAKLTGEELNDRLHSGLPDDVHDKYAGVVGPHHLELYFSEWPVISDTNFGVLGSIITSSGLKVKKLFLLKGTNTAVLRVVESASPNDLHSSTNTHSQASNLFN